MKPILALRPPEQRRWDDGIIWTQIILDGELPPAPAQCNAGRYAPADIWPRVEGSLGRGIGQRHARFLIAQAHGKATHWTPPSWWQIEFVEAETMTFHDDGSEAGMVPQPVKMSKTSPGAYALKKHHALKFTVQIDGVRPGADEFVEYYLQWRHLTGDPATRERLRAFAALQQQGKALE